MKGFQDRLFKDFDVIKVRTETGRIRRKYVYRGKYAFWKMPESMLLRYRRMYAGCAFLMCLLFLWGAFQTEPVNASKMVGGMTLLAAVALMALVIGLVRFIAAKKKMYLRDCLQMRDLILWSSMIFFLLQTAAAVSGVWFLIRDGVSGRSILVVLSFGLTAGMSMAVFLTQLKLTYVIEGEETTGKMWI